MEITMSTGQTEIICFRFKKAVTLANGMARSTLEWVKLILILYFLFTYLISR